MNEEMANLLLPNSRGDPSKISLICFPHAGGGTAAYYRWRPLLPHWLELVPVRLPGRESRSSEPPYTRFSDLIDDLAAAIAPLVDKNLALLGNSFGAAAAFELAREMRRRGIPAPKMLVVAACRAPSRPATQPQIHDLPDEEFIHQLNDRYGGIPTEVSRHRELLQLILPALRADVRLIETYTFCEEEPLNIEVLALGGTEDRTVTAADLAVWRRQTHGHFSFRQFPGGHFFLVDAGTGRSFPALPVIVERLRRYVSE